MKPSSEDRNLTDLEPVVALTGAGISAESGIPTFRGDDGLWKNHRAQDLATPAVFRENPSLSWEFYNWRRKLIASCTPNPGHFTLAQMEDVLTDFTIITQNVDGFHHQAGSKNVIEIHGSIWELQCTNCHQGRVDHELYEGNTIPRCHNCGGMMRPGVIWFGESLNLQSLNAAFDACSRAATMMIIGTSALVQPANSLPIIAKENGATLIEVNPAPTPLSPMVNIRLNGPSGEMLPGWWQEVQIGLLDPDKNLSITP
jgi:NAD-dependent deacetylase